MRALQFTGPDQFHLNEVDRPELGPDEVLVASRSVGICHSDIELLAGRYIIPFEYPVIPGHEWSGEVVAVGREVKALGVGDRVVGECVIGDDHFGFSISGAAAEFFVAKEAWLHRLPDNLSWTQGALVEPFSCGYYATRPRRQPRRQRHGPRARGRADRARRRRRSVGRGARVIVAEPSAARGELARQLGADVVLDPTRGLRRAVQSSPTATARPSSSRRAASRRRWRRRSRSLRSAPGSSTSASTWAAPHLRGSGCSSPRSSRRAASSVRRASGRRPCASSPAAASTSAHSSPPATLWPTPRRRSPPFWRTGPRSRSTSPRPPTLTRRGADACAQECSTAARPSGRGPTRPAARER